MFTFTKQERQVILFIFTVALSGLGVNYYLKLKRSPQLSSCFDKNLGKLDLNAADSVSLMKLEGIGEKLATRILEYRRSSGGFGEIEELKKIKGITECRFNKLKDLLFVREE